MRNAYAWMGKRRKPGYATTSKRQETLFDNWLWRMNINIREAALLLDLPEQRCRHLQMGRHGHKLGRKMGPSAVTRLAMAAIFRGLPAALETPDCYELRDRLAEAAVAAGLAPWSESDNAGPPAAAQAPDSALPTEQAP